MKKFLRIAWRVCCIWLLLFLLPQGVVGVLHLPERRSRAYLGLPAQGELSHHVRNGVRWYVRHVENKRIACSRAEEAVLSGKR